MIVCNSVLRIRIENQLKFISMKHVKTVINVLFVKFSKNEMPCQSEFMDGCKFCPERGLEEQERSVHSVCVCVCV